MSREKELECVIHDLSAECREERKQIQELEAHVTVLREALLQMKKHAEDYGQAWARAYVTEYRDLLPGSAKEQFDLLAIMQRRLDKVGEALSQTPEQSLAEIKKAERERCAKYADSFAYISPNFTALAEEIRSMED